MTKDRVLESSDAGKETDTATLNFCEATQSPTKLPSQRVVDLFCGAGGLATGFEAAGFEAILGLDVWPAATETFRHHHSSAATLTNDISAIQSDKLLELVGCDVGELGVVCGGPPCQGFSLAGKSLADDPRNYLYKHFLRVVETLQPRWVVMENVPALLKNEEVARSIVADLENPSHADRKHYQVSFGILNSAWFGVPQTRRRVIFLAKRIDVDATVPDISTTVPMFLEGQSLFGEPSYITFSEATSDLPPIEAGQGAEELVYSMNAQTPYQAMLRGDLSIREFFRSLRIDLPEFVEGFKKSDYVYNHLAQEHSDLLVERFANIPPGGDKGDLRRIRPDLLPPDGHPEQGLTYGRLWADRPAPTIPANYSRPSGNRSIHPTFARLITPREAMRASSFPDYYRLYGGKVAQREQVGNSVPPLLALYIANLIRTAEGI